MTLWWGTFPVAGLGSPAGQGEGLWRSATPEAIGAAQELVLPAPAFLVTHPRLPLVYAVTESEDSAVHVIDIARPAAPRLLGTVPTGGSSACHILLAPDLRTLYITHYMSGEVVAVRLSEDGFFRDDAPAQAFFHTGSGPRSDRQEAPHAHSSLIAPGGRHLLVVDLGTDELRRYVLGTDGSLTSDGIAAVLPPGAGPRHAVARGALIYVTCELDNQVRTLRWDAETSSAVLVDEQPSTLVPPRSAALQDSHVALVPGHTGDVLLVGVRGADVISVFDVAPEGELTYRGAFDVGQWPRYFAVFGDRVLVAAERAHEVRSFALADVIGLPPEHGMGDVAALPYVAAPVPSPACVVEGP